MRQLIKEIYRTALHSAQLSRQLLAFARRQSTSPVPLDLNSASESMLKLLRRLIGENIELKWEPASALWTVTMDPGQVDQVLANLCVNARDAIRKNGRVIISTANITMDTAFCAAHPGAAQGDYVRLMVSDNGGGIDDNVLAHIFEPFSTIKEPDKETGSGLATVYGIAKQNKGYLDVESRVGQGTSVSLYIPRRKAAENEPSPEAIDPSVCRGGNETIVLVEDEPLILLIAQKFLRSLGYKVHPFGNPKEAVSFLRTVQDPVDLLLSDVIMPDLNGYDLSVIAQRERPGLKVLFMSGYTADVIASQGILAGHVHLLQKPFTRAEMALRLRKLLDAS